ncbi:MAG: choice-of-anchor D domain-containing protein [Myxococcaceae bacterium]|nr:choice-of-anchor D domain-containing protein [Myxococcaceae bacterium]MCA3016015.1 choice-of-anchor D domain-containing protein [Myxococcaceae bacterium]
MNASRAVAALTVALALSSCQCGQTVRRTFPKIEVIDAMGADRGSLDFGQVQLNATATASTRVRNGGNADLSITKATFSSPKFGLGETLPVTVGASEEVMFAFTFRPTEPDVRETATVTLETNDPARPTVQLTLLGTGIAAVATVMPRTLDFGEVYLRESKSLEVTLTNAGSNELEVTGATLGATAATLGLTGVPQGLVGPLAAGASRKVAFTFAPTATGDLMTALDVTFGGGLDPLRVTVRGKAIEAVPRLCFRFEDSPMETCSDRTTTMLNLPFGALCDGRLFPPDGGRACVGSDGGTAPASRSGRLYVRNEGNTPVQYAFNVNLLAGGRCDGGAVADFEFASNPSDGGRFVLPTAQLPASTMDPRPWETPPVRVTYRPTSRCRDDGADQAQVFWLRQNEPAGTNRQPQTVTMILSGQSLLPRGITSDITVNLSGTVPNVVQSYNGLANAGDAPLTVVSASLWQGAALADGGMGGAPDEECVTGTGGSCRFFRWVMAPVLPATLPGTSTPSMPSSRPLGQLGFGAFDGGTAPQTGTMYRIFAVFETDDPYGAPCPYPTVGSCVVSSVRAIAN